MSLVSVLTGRADGTGETGAPGPRRLRWVTGWNAATIAAPVLVILAMGWHRRWISDDGLIFTRTVRQILAGNGPVYNVGERAEASTSTLWQWLLVAAGWITRADVGALAVHLGLLCSAAGYALALDATRRLHLRGGASGSRLVVPFGVLVLIALPPVWDFATSGLETGLTTLWTAGCWWLLVRLYQGGGRRVSLGLAFLAGLGPLVRPDLAIASAGFLIAIAVLRRPRPLSVLGHLGAALATPLAYEIFRMGYYGVLLPLPAVTKEASSSDWARGWDYVEDLTGPYRLWLPLTLVVAAGVAVLARRAASRPGGPMTLPRPGAAARARLTVVAVPVLCGLLMLLYVTRVGGDFMHGRMLLPGLFTLLLPVLLVPAGRISLPAAGAVVVWALVCAFAFRVPYTGIGPQGVADERGYYVGRLGIANPVSAAAYMAHYPEFPAAVKATAAGGERVILYPLHGSFYVTPLRDDIPASTATVWGNLGMNGAGTPLDGISVDILGLAYPLAAHVELTGRGRPGHEKEIDIAWVFAQYADPDSVLPPGVDPLRVEAARYALTCGTENRGALKELQDSVRAPMTWGRFWDNLTGAFDRTSFRFPGDPVEAAQEICGVDTATLRDLAAARDRK